VTPPLSLRQVFRPNTSPLRPTALYYRGFSLPSSPDRRIRGCSSFFFRGRSAYPWGSALRRRSRPSYAYCSLLHAISLSSDNRPLVKRGPSLPEVPLLLPSSPLQDPVLQQAPSSFSRIFRSRDPSSPPLMEGDFFREGPVSPIPSLQVPPPDRSPAPPPPQ